MGFGRFTWGKLLSVELHSVVCAPNPGWTLSACELLGISRYDGLMWRSMAGEVGNAVVVLDFERVKGRKVIFLTPTISRKI